MVGGQQTPEGMLKAVQTEYQKETRPVTRVTRIGSGRGPTRSPRPMAVASASAARARAQRGTPKACTGWLFVAPALAFYVAFVLRPLVLSVQYSLYEWNGIGPATWVGLTNYVTVLHRSTTSADRSCNAFELIVFFSFVPVVLGLVVAS